MAIKCPSCGSNIPKRIIDYKHRLARCPHCANTAPLSGELFSTHPSSGSDEWDQTSLRSDRVHIEKTADSIVMSYRFMDPGLMQIVILLSSAGFLLCALAGLMADDWARRATGLLFLLGAYFALVTSLNSVKLQLTPGFLKIRYVPLPSLGGGSHARSIVQGVRIVKGADEGGDHYIVYVDRKGKRSLPLSPVFRSAQMAQQIADTISHWAEAERVA